jgi:peptidoglycan-associated lipoprotein
MKSFLSTAVLVATLALLAGCSGKPPEQPPQPPQQPTGDTSAVDDANAAVDDTATGGPSGELLSKRIIYFDFDKTEIRADSQSGSGRARAVPGEESRAEGAPRRPCRRVAARASTTSVSGERRGQAVRRALLLQGVAEAQLSTVSYGEERPAAARQ